MERLTTDKPVSEMGMVELAHNSCFAKDRNAMYRDYDREISARDLTREIAVNIGIWKSPHKYGLDADNEMIDDDIFDDTMLGYLSCETDTKEGLLALFYRNLWAQADLYEVLKKYESTGFEPKQVTELRDHSIELENRCIQMDKAYRELATKYAALETS